MNIEPFYSQQLLTHASDRTKNLAAVSFAADCVAPPSSLRAKESKCSLETEPSFAQASVGQSEVITYPNGDVAVLYYATGTRAPSSKKMTRVDGATVFVQYSITSAGQPDYVQTVETNGTTTLVKFSPITHSPQTVTLRVPGRKEQLFVADSQGKMHAAFGH